MGVLAWMKEHDSTGLGRTSDFTGNPSRPQPEQAGFRISSDSSRNSFGFPAAVSLGSLGSLQPPVCAKFLIYFIHIFLDLTMTVFLSLD